MITQLQPDILECEVKWALGSMTKNKARGGDGIQFSSVVQPCLTVCDLMDCSTPVHHQLPEPAQTHIHWIGNAIQPAILCHPLLLLPSTSASIRVFSVESVLLIRWPKYWSLRFSISPSNEYSGLISFRMDWLDLLAVQETLKSLLQHHSSNTSILLQMEFRLIYLKS